MSDIIRAEHLSYSYPGEEEGQSVQALRDVSFSVKEGEFVAVLGHNCCGKSTLAKILCMILLPGEGKLYIDGKDMTGEDVTEEDIYEGRRKVGMVFQNPDNQLVATIVEEDVAFGPENLGLPPEKIRRRVDWALETVGMTKYARHATHRLSGGQKQRIAIAGAIAMDRKCIIFDESTAMLDPHGRKEVMDTISRLNREEGITVIHITHYMNEATIADRVLVMQDGGILMEGTPEKVFSQPEKLWKAGLDVPQTTELLWYVQQAGYDVALDIFDPAACACEIAKVLKGTPHGRDNA